MTKPGLDGGALTKGSCCSRCQTRCEADEWTARRKLRDAVRARDRAPASAAAAGTG
jgi:hypothetical protein